VYRRLQLPCYELSCAEQRGVAALRAKLDGSVTMFVGQSGVGKSSLVNALAPQAEAQTAELTRDAEGRHTTTTARWYRLDSHSAIVDAPGVRDFAPPAHITRAAEHGFVEVHAAAAGCRFNDCRHFDEPGCQVRSEVVAEKISARRYESYRRLARLYEDLAS
jgi:ribosome biogenesis GTPase